MKTLRNKAILYAAVALLIVCSSWGFLMHRTINQLAVYQLPKEMQPFFYKNMDYIVKQSIRPDERRNKDTTEAPKHFIDFEAFGDSAAWKMPMNWDEAVKKYSRDTLVEYGYVPYWTIIMKEQLTAAFRQGNKDSILFYAADLAHYIGDAHVHLHTSLNYDGQLTGQKGLHALWESVAPELTLEQFNLTGKKKAKYLKHPDQAIWEAVRHAHTLLPAVFGVEKELTKDFTDSTKYRIQKRNGRDVKYYTKEFGLAYGKRLEPDINDQAIRAANLTADFWYTAWVDAGKPDLENLIHNGFSKEEEKALKAEKKAYKKNQLLKQGLLVAKKDAVKDPANN
jgi:hypothetical protein